jgi:N-acyl-D-aspartate/D-glutamate deacylase
MAADRVLIKRGRVVDGSGGPSFVADILVDGDTIAAIGNEVPPVDAAVLDAADCVVAPGFIDIHSHSDFTILAFPSADSAVLQGVTSVVNGNCGGGVAPALPKHDVRRVAFAYNPAWGLEITWSSFGDYLSQLKGVAVNVATLVPHGAIRNAVMGLDDRPPDAVEMEAMKALLAESLDAGGAGLSTGLEYQPGCYADADEIAQLAREVADRGGLYATHMRNRADNFAASTREAIDVAVRSGVRLQLSHIAPRPYAPPDQVRDAFGAIEQAVDEGLPIWVDTFPETWGPGLLVDLFPKEVTQGTPREVLARLSDPHVRREIDAYFSGGTNFLVRAGGYADIFIASTPTEYELIGRSLEELAADTQQPVGERACDLLLDAGDLLMSVVIRHVYATEDALSSVLSLPYCSLGSDGIVITGEDRDCPYPWSASTYGYAPRTLAHYAGEQGLFNLEEAIRRLTALPAAALKLDDRGLLREGYKADLVILEPSKIVDRTTPPRAARHPQGIRDVFVNGVPTVRDGEITGSRAGQLLTLAR